MIAESTTCRSASVLVPREPIMMRQCTEAELETIEKSRTGSTARKAR
jgi:hypothetical protein